MLVITTAILFLAACGGKKGSGQTVKDFMPISEGFEKYSVWIETDGEPVRDSTIENVYVFKKGKVTMYNLDSKQGSVAIEDILDMSDDELIKLAHKTSDEIYENDEKEIKETKLFDVETFNKIQTEVQSTLESKYGEDFKESLDEYYKELKPMTEDIYYRIEGERPEQQSSTYTLDIRIDDLGQRTEAMILTIPNANSELVNNTGNGDLVQYVDFLFYEEDTFFLKWDSEELFNDHKESYVKELKNQGEFVEKDGFELTHPQNYVPNPYVWEEKEGEIKLNSELVHQKIFETTFSGIKTSGGSLLTRVDDSFVGFQLDDPDTKKKNVTVEGKSK